MANSHGLASPTTATTVHSQCVPSNRLSGFLKLCKTEEYGWQSTLQFHTQKRVVVDEDHKRLKNNLAVFVSLFLRFVASRSSAASGRIPSEIMAKIIRMCVPYISTIARKN